MNLRSYICAEKLPEEAELLYFYTSVCLCDRVFFWGWDVIYLSIYL